MHGAERGGGGVEDRRGLERWRDAFAAVGEALPGDCHPELRGLTLFGVEIALLDLVGKKLGAPLHELLGGRVHDRVDVCWVAYMRGEMTAEAELEALSEEVRDKLAAVSRPVVNDHPERINRDPDAVTAVLARIRERSPIDIIEHVADLAVASANVTVPSDLVSPGLLVDDICATPFEYRRGGLEPPAGPGLGVELDEARMAKWAV